MSSHKEFQQQQKKNFNSMGWNNNQKAHQNQCVPLSEYSKSVSILLSFETWL